MKNGKIKVVLGKIIVINPVGEGKYPTITPSSKGMLTINGKEIYETTKVNESDEIEQLLKEANVIYGIKEEAIEEITKAQNGGRVLVAEGLKPIDAIDEKIEFVFNKEDVSIGEYEKIDYKNINKINGVEATAIIGKVIKGEDSKFGINVFGQVVAISDINITGSIVNSTVISGGSEVRKQKRINALQMFLRTYEALIETLEYLADKGIVKNESNIPEVMNQLLESKFKEFNKQVMEIISLAIKDGDKNSQVSKFIKEKLLPMSRTNINSIKELRNFVISLLEEIQYLEEYMANMSSITLSYCQEASIQSSGDILINGKGLYSTDMYAVRSIKFLNKQSVCRGGVLKAGEFINASVVGSEAGAHNVLEVFGKKGIVTIEKAYSNTLIIINNKRYLITEPCRNVKCYIDNKGELAVEKLVL